MGRGIGQESMTDGQRRTNIDRQIDRWTDSQTLQRNLNKRKYQEYIKPWHSNNIKLIMMLKRYENKKMTKITMLLEYIKKLYLDDLVIDQLIEANCIDGICISFQFHYNE